VTGTAAFERQAVAETVDGKQGALERAQPERPRDRRPELVAPNHDGAPAAQSDRRGTTGPIARGHRHLAQREGRTEPLVGSPVGQDGTLVEGTAGQPWWNDTTFYEIFLRSFFDSNGDGVGDLNGLIQKLDYLNDNQDSTNDDLGVTGIWLMPIFPSPSYHGYDVTDYMSINPDYGTLEDFNQFLDEAHQRGIKVIIDMPLNHTSSAHPWFKKALEMDPTYRDYYIWSAEDPGYQGPWGQDPWHESPNGDYYYGIFWSEMPDLNYDNPAVVDEMKNVFKFWLDLGVDGFRLDGARYIIEEGKKQADTASTHQFYKELRTFVKGINPEALLLGEVWTDAFTTSTYIKNGEELDLVFDFDLANAFMSSATSGNADKALNGLKFSQKLFSGGRSAPFLTNHDMDRVMSVLDGDVEKAKNAAFMLLTAPGVPFIYYGEEIGMTDSKLPFGAALDPIPHKFKFVPRIFLDTIGLTINRDEVRTPMQWDGTKNAGFSSAEKTWLPVHENYGKINVETQHKDADSLLNTIRALMKIRRAEKVIREGSLGIIKGLSDCVLGYTRMFDNEKVFILLNFSEKNIKFQFENLKAIFHLSKMDEVKDQTIHLGKFGGIILKNTN